MKNKNTVQALALKLIPITTLITAYEVLIIHLERHNKARILFKNQTNTKTKMLNILIQYIYTSNLK